MRRLGYKASAEQFAPLELLKFSQLTEEKGFDSVFLSAIIFNHGVIPTVTHHSQWPGLGQLSGREHLT
jgi:hypothetical protein